MGEGEGEGENEDGRVDGETETLPIFLLSDFNCHLLSFHAPTKKPVQKPA